MTRRKRLSLTPNLAFAICVLLFGPVILPAPSLAAPAQAPAFTIDLLAGSKVSSSSLRGKVVVLNFWASWCAPCKRELAELDAAFVRYGPSRLAVFAIDAEHAPEPRRLAQQAAVMTIPVATAISDGYRPRNNAVPTTFVIDKAGRLILIKAGALKPGELDALLASLLAPNSANGNSR